MGFSMSFHMSFKTAIQFQTTYSTFIALGATVLILHMPSKISILSENHTTNGTRKGLFSAVDSHMSAKVFPPVEAFTADGALVAPLFVMDPHMSTEKTGVTESLITDSTAMNLVFFFLMNFHV